MASPWMRHMKPEERRTVKQIRERCVQRIRAAKNAEAAGRVRQQYQDMPRPEARVSR
jgi:hypothetical protein